MKKIALASTALASLSLASAPRAVHAAPRADVSDPKQLLAELKTSFEEFKKANDENLKAKVDDVILNEKIEKIDASMNEITSALEKAQADLAAAKLGGTPGDMQPTDPEYVQAFNAHFRKGDVSAALSVGTDAEGGYVAPVEWDRTIGQSLRQISPMRTHSQIITTSTAGFKRLYSDRTIGSGWVGETAARPETTTPGISELTFGHGEIYANPAATQQFLDDAAVNVEQWLADEVEHEFAVQEGIAFLSGNGTNKPFGVLTYVAGEANASKHPFGAIAKKDAASAAAIDEGEIMDTVYALPSERRMGAQFFMNLTTLAMVRKIKDADGNYIWQPGLTEGEPARLLGYPVVEMSGMPDPAASSIPVLFGNMRETYLIIDRIGIRILRDPYTNKPFVHFYTTKRVGGGVQNPEYMRAIKMAAS